MLNPRMPKCDKCENKAVIQWVGGNQCAAHNSFYEKRKEKVIGKRKEPKK